MKAYRVQCEWDKTGWWVVTIPEVPGAVTQCKRLDKVPGDVGEVLELLTGEKPGTYELNIDPVGLGKAGETAAKAHDLRAQADALAGAVATTTCTAVVTLAKSGFSMRDIGQLVGVSHQRVNQILKADETARPQRSGKRTSIKAS